MRKKETGKTSSSHTAMPHPTSKYLLASYAGDNPSPRGEQPIAISVRNLCRSNNHEHASNTKLAHVGSAPGSHRRKKDTRAWTAAWMKRLFETRTFLQSRKQRHEFVPDRFITPLCWFYVEDGAVDMTVLNETA